MRGATSVHRLVTRGGGESHGDVSYACPATTAASARIPPSPRSRRRSRRATRCVLAAPEAESGGLRVPNTFAGVHRGARVRTCRRLAHAAAGSRRLPDAQRRAPSQPCDAWDAAVKAPAAPFDAQVPRSRHLGVGHRLPPLRPTFESARAAAAYTARLALEEPGPLAAQNPAVPPNARVRARRWGSQNTRRDAANTRP
ncbi:hypothetical protein B0H15DRAFT_950016 [Mycena belliarum]|uniref:Uncharacterized protein n=1 Tax=Mycena belliarum TaxID=1033014 RepID=A0AAD6U7T9_9AGAR|nr:hypothetical protein B0H15DRAFT_950016 [Mycena belliae]